MKREVKNRKSEIDLELAAVFRKYIWGMFIGTNKSHIILYVYIVVLGRKDILGRKERIRGSDGRIEEAKRRMFAGDRKKEILMVR